MKRTAMMTAAVFVLIVTAKQGFCADPLNLGPEQLVKANGVDIDVGTYSVPSFVDWDSNGLSDLVIGGGDGKVYVYLNVGTKSSPQFLDYFYAQSNGADLYCPPAGCMGCFPRVVYWDMDARKDLLVGQADGTVKIFLNIGSDSDPFFDGGSTLYIGYKPYNNEDMNVGALTTVTMVDWDKDYRKDVVAGALDGRIHIYLNCGCSSSTPAFYHTEDPSGDEFAQENGTDLVVPENGSSPVILDLDGDGRKDLLTGNAAGQVLFYSNVGTDKAPAFSGYVLVESNGIPIDLAGDAWSRPFVCDWTGDGRLDVLVGAADGRVHLFQGRWEPDDLDGDYDFDLGDFAVMASAWRSQPGNANWNPLCDISEPGDEIIDELDLAVLTEKWLTGAQ